MSAVARRCLWHTVRPDQARTWSVDRLAYIGDAVYELYARMEAAASSNAPSGGLHHQTVRRVSALAQSHALATLNDILTDDEHAIVRRGRNHRPKSAPRHADPIHYRLATGFETLIGYLYVCGEDERVRTLITHVWEHDTP